MLSIDGKGIPSHYCEECGACGEFGCCSPLKCKMGPNCLYPYYLDELKEAWTQREKIYQTIWNSDDMYGDAYKLRDIEEILRGEDVL